MHRSFSIALLFLLFLTGCDVREQHLMEQGDRLVERIDSFQAENGRLPASLTEMGIEEKLEGPLYYDMLSDSTYMIWFGLSLGESMIYRSETMQWRDR